MNPRKRLVVILAGSLAVLTLGLAVLYGTRGTAVHDTPPPILDKFELTAERSAIPDMQFADGMGAMRSLSEFRGRVLLVNLWATWCAPCVAELPDLAEAHEALKDAAVAILPIDMERLEADKVAEFLEEKNAGALPVYIDRTYAVMRGMEANALPLTVLIDKEGNEIGRAQGAQAWNHPDVISYLRFLAQQ
jgi:thiol-disulfide isomerase/thioredoxin